MSIKAICFYYPPLNSSEGFSAYKLLCKSNHNLEIFSQKELMEWTYTFDDIVLKNVKYISAQNNWFNNVLENIDISNNDILITRSMPNDAHTLGLKILKKNQIKWIAFFSDPFSDSPITKIENLNKLKGLFYSHKYINFVTTWIKIFIGNFILSYNERKIFKNADYLVFNNEYLLNFMLRKHSKYKSKSIIIPHTYDQSNELYLSNYLDEEIHKIKISFIGSLSVVRNLDNYLKAVLRIKNNNISNNVEFIFIGCNKKLLESKIPLHLIKYIENVSYKDSLKIMNDSDWLINSDAHINIKENIYMPCKLIDYLSFTKNVINISNFKKSPTIDIVRMNGGVNLPDDEEAIFHYLKKIILQKKKKTKPSADIKKYANVNVVNILDDLIDNLAKREL